MTIMITIKIIKIMTMIMITIMLTTTTTTTTTKIEFSVFIIISSSMLVKSAAGVLHKNFRGLGFKPFRIYLHPDGIGVALQGTAPQHHFIHCRKIPVPPPA